MDLIPPGKKAEPSQPYAGEEEGRIGSNRTNWYVIFC